MAVWISECVLQPLVILSLVGFLAAEYHDYPTAQVSTSWTNNYISATNITSAPSDNASGRIMRITLLKEIPNARALSGVACGFISNGTNDHFSFAIAFVRAQKDFSPGQELWSHLDVVWLANRNKPVHKNATLHLLSEGDLVLRDADGTLVWSTNTSNMSVVGMKMMETGNLVLYDGDNKTVWQSFDHPTDTLLPGQKLKAGQNLVASVSATNWSEGSFYLSVTSQGLFAFYQSNEPQMYFKFPVNGRRQSTEPSYVKFVNGTLALYISSAEPSEPDAVCLYPILSSLQYMKVDSDGHFRVYDGESCKEACLEKCSCKAAFFQYYNLSNGNCFLPSPVFSLIHDGQNRNANTSFAIIKISNESDSYKTGTSATAIRAEAITGSIIGVYFIVVLIIGFWIMFSRKKNDSEEDAEDYSDQLSAMPMRFFYEKLIVATGNFCKKLGEGGFGSVYEGNLENGEKIAVKRLDGLGQGKKEFLAEVKTIGSIHHVNLVRLIGFCAERLNRLLIYEFMCNGSLDKWIFYGNPMQPALDWQIRRTIILDIAKGLAYLHEECRQRIVHLDIKPQNILLDENFNAKISDFGLAKLIDRDQSQVVTTLRGTPGYLAPEWFSSVITEKVDVYSFGIVVMEVICGRKNLDRSQPEECMHLLRVFLNKAEEDQLIDMVDKHSEDMQLHRLEAVKMMRVAVWCLQNDYTRRPSMSTVVKVLEGTIYVKAELDYSMPDPRTMAAMQRGAELEATATVSPTVLSGPR